MTHEYIVIHMFKINRDQMLYIQNLEIEYLHDPNNLSFASEINISLEIIDSR